MTKADKIKKQILGKLSAVQGIKNESRFHEANGGQKRHTPKYVKHIVKQHGREKAKSVLIRKEFQNRTRKAAA